MNAGDTVYVYPLGHPEKAEPGVLVLCSGNQQSCAVQFDELPLFLGAVMRRGGQIGIDRSVWKVTMLLFRESDTLPWKDIGNEGVGHLYRVDQERPQ